MRRRWDRLGLRGRLAISIGALFVVSFGLVFAVVRVQMAHETRVIEREQGEERASPGGPQSGETGEVSPIADAQSDAEKTFLFVGAATLAAALLAGYLLAARTASPLRRYAETASEVDAGDLSPRLDADPSSPVELRVLAETFNRMLDRLEAAFARQRAFVADASHELRTPLTAIRGQLEILARHEDPGAEEVRRVEAKTMIEMRRVERLVDDLLALARLDEGPAPVRRRFELAPFLRELCEANRAEPTELAQVDSGTVDADPELVAQVVRNLLGNAHRHGRRVSLSCRSQGGVVTVAVDDDGPGIPAAEREAVFERFHRSDASRQRASGGSGLGLAISSSIVEAHGGRIWIEDSPLGGARVSFSLPGFEPSVRDLSASS